MRKREIEQIRKELEKEKDSLLEEVKRVKQREADYLNETVGDDVDKALGNAQREILFYLNDHDRQRMDAIEDALHNIDAGRYGICEECGKKINNDRLKALPWVRLCMKCKPSHENNNT